MPISAHGQAKLRAGNWRRGGGTDGYTLVELLIVLTIIGLLSAAVVVALPDGRQELAADAERFAARAKAAQDMAILESSAVSVRVGKAGYGFDRRQGAEWVAIAHEPFEATRWREGVEPVIDGVGVDRITFDPIGATTPWRLVLRGGGDQMAIELAQNGQIHVAR